MCLVSRAVNGLTPHDIKYNLSLAEGRVYAHCGSLIAGSRMVWADPNARPDRHAFKERMNRLTELRRKLKF